MPHILSYDLGTGGLKAGIYTAAGKLVRFAFRPYPTRHAPGEIHEQRPEDWWEAVCSATRALLDESGIPASDIVAVSSSGHSQMAIPMDASGRPLTEFAPIWCDRRAVAQAKRFFEKTDYERWYRSTGNGDPPETYALFKLLWLRDEYPELWKKTAFALGSKDYIHFRLTGRAATDGSYASGLGAFCLQEWRYDAEYGKAAGIDREILPEIIDSSALVGSVTREAAGQCGLLCGTPVYCGGVDNACMALGTLGMRENSAYLSLGTSAWIAVTAKEPYLNAQTRPFVFAHVEKGFYTSGVSIFCAAGAYRWARETLCPDLQGDAFAEMDALAAQAAPGSGGLLFNPTLSGASPQEPGEGLIGSYWGLGLGARRQELLRAVLEGVAYSLKRYCLDPIVEAGLCRGDIAVCGGGAKSPVWMQILADVFGRGALRLSVGQDAASLGAAAIAARGAGLWRDYSPLNDAISVRERYAPCAENSALYAREADRFERWTRALAALGEKSEGGTERG